MQGISKVTCPYYSHTNLLTLTSLSSRRSLLLQITTNSWECQDICSNTTMESLIRQTRARFSGSQQDNKDDTRDRTVQPQRTQSFRDKKRGPSWIRRQFSRQMSWDYDFSGADYPTAVAAAAYAIQSLEESKSRDQKDARGGGPENNLNKMKSKADDARAPPERIKSALKSSDDGNASFKKPEKAPSMKKKISFADEEITSQKPEGPTVEKEPERVPSMKMPPSFTEPAAEKTPEGVPSMKTAPSPADERLNITGSQTPEISPYARPPSTRRPGPADSKADIWEKEQLASIRDRYEKLKATIDEWESKKKKKAKRKIERTEAELDKRRAKALKNYHSEVKRIEAVAGGARSQAEENRRNEEFKAKEKANRIRATGKVPATCLCF